MTDVNFYHLKQEADLFGPATDYFDQIDALCAHAERLGVKGYSAESDAGYISPLYGIHFKNDPPAGWNAVGPGAPGGYVPGLHAGREADQDFAAFYLPRVQKLIPSAPALRLTRLDGEIIAVYPTANDGPEVLKGAVQIGVDELAERITLAKQRAGIYARFYRNRDAYLAPEAPHNWEIQELRQNLSIQAHLFGGGPE